MDEYISREALMRDLSESLIFSVRDGVIGGEIRGASKVIDRIEAAPAADVVEAKHGWWLQNGMCSECLVIPETSHKNYCPNCGTKMDGKRKAVSKHDEHKQNVAYDNQQICRGYR